MTTPKNKRFLAELTPEMERFVQAESRKLEKERGGRFKRTATLAALFKELIELRERRDNA